MRPSRLRALAALAAVCALGAVPATAGATTFNELTDVLGGVQASTGTGFFPALSHDGTVVAYDTRAPEFAAGGGSNVYVYDQATGTSARVSQRPDGGVPNADSHSASIGGPGGRYVAYQSSATDIVTGAGNGKQQIYIYDRTTGTTVRASPAVGGGDPDADVNLAPDSFSADGRYLTFYSAATNLVGGDTNGHQDVFVRDLVTNTTTLVSAAFSGGSGNADSVVGAMSADGRHVAFRSDASDLLAPGQDTNGAPDVYVRDLDTLTTERVSVNGDGSQAGAGTPGAFHASISGDGRYVAFVDTADGLDPSAPDSNGHSDIYVRDRVGHTTTLVSRPDGAGQSDGDSEWGKLSANGRYVVFDSTADNLVGQDLNATSDVFLRDISGGRTEPLSYVGGISSANGKSDFAEISDDGFRIVFETKATTLVASDGNGAATDDILVTRRDTVGMNGTIRTAGGVGTNSAAVAANSLPDGSDVHGEVFFSDGTRTRSGSVVCLRTAGPDSVLVYRLDTPVRGLPGGIVWLHDGSPDGQRNGLLTPRRLARYTSAGCGSVPFTPRPNPVVSGNVVVSDEP